MILFKLIPFVLFPKKNYESQSFSTANELDRKRAGR